MTTEIKAPQFPEAVADGTVATWHKKAGDTVARDELLVDIETDKVVLEVVAPHDGVLSKVLKGEGVGPEQLLVPVVACVLLTALGVAYVAGRLRAAALR